MTFMADSPFASRTQSAASQVPRLNDLETISNKSRSSEGLNKSRPSSQIAIKKSSVSSLPTSARSDERKSGKSSPVPVKDAIPPASRHKNKGLEMSSAMMDIFGDSSSSSEPTYHRRTRGRNANLSQPGPEWFEGFEKLDMTNIELPDPNCPAEKVLRGEEHVDFNPLLPGPDIGAGVDDEEQEEEEEEMEEQLVESRIAENDYEEEAGSSPSKKGHPKADGPPADTSRNGESADGRGESTSDEEGADGQSGTGGESKQSAGGKGGGMTVLLVKNAQVINDDAVFVADVLVEDGVISNVSPNIDVPDGAEVIDASGKMLLPAGIDVYTQLTADGSIDDVPTGCKSAVAGGTATIIEVVRARASESLVSAVKRVKSQLDGTKCHVALSVAIADFNDTIRQELTQVVANDGVNSIVLDGVQISDGKLFELLELARQLGAHVRVVPENKSIVSVLERKMLKLGVTGPEGFPQSRPEPLEAQKTATVCVLGNLANCPVSIVSLSSEASLRALEQNSEGLSHAEIASAAIAADGSGYLQQEASAYLLDTPLRKNVADRLLSALATLPLATCSSAHKPVNRDTVHNFVTAVKGSSGAEERMSVVWERAVRTGRIDPMRFTAITSTNAAKIFNLYPKKGRIAVGADADLVIWETSGRARILDGKTTQSAQQVSIYDGHTVHSSVFATIVAGRIAYQEGQIRDDASGGFLSLAPNSPYLFSMVSQREKFPHVEKVERATGQNGSSVPPPPVATATKDFDRNRQKVMESSIGFGAAAQSRGRNPPGGRTTGFW